MTVKKNILVFPCGSEVALEIYRSLEFSNHFNLIGGSSVDDHGKFVFVNYVPDIPFVNDENFIKILKGVIKEHNVDFIFPATDYVIYELKKNESNLGCKIISSSFETVEVCLSKSKTYRLLSDVIKTPILFNDVSKINKYPVFLKPDVGYGSRGVFKANNENDVVSHLNKNPQNIILEFLPGKEYTVDCFTNFKKELIFVGSRERSRISNGISVNTKTMYSDSRFLEIAELINEKLELNGAWFFQVKERNNGELVLLEVASRLAGSSAVYRALGINFSSLSIFNAMEIPVEILENNYEVELDRALYNVCKINLKFNHIYIDLDDTIIVDGKVNFDLVAVIYKFINQGKKIHLITKHKFDVNLTLLKYRIKELFDTIIHLQPEDSKADYIKHSDSIFIDDSFAERKEVFVKLNLKVFSVDQTQFL